MVKFFQKQSVQIWTFLINQHAKHFYIYTPLTFAIIKKSFTYRSYGVRMVYVRRSYVRLFVHPITKCTIMYYEETAGARSTNFCTRVHVDKIHLPANFYPNPQCPWSSFSRSKFKSSTFWRLNIIILQTVTDQTNIAIANTAIRMWTFNWHNYIWPWPILKITVKVMHISTINILQTVRDRANIAIAKTESHMWPFNCHITFDHGPF